MRSSTKKWLFTSLKVALVLLLAWGIHRSVQSAFTELEREKWSASELRPGWLVLSGVLYLLGLLPMGIYWCAILRVMGQAPRLGETLRAYFIGHLGKYVPGKALVIILRTSLIRSHRVDTSIAAVSIFYETLTMMAVGAFWAGAILAVYYRHQTRLVLAAVGMMVAAGLPTLPPIFRRVVGLLRVGKSNPAVAEQFGRLKSTTLAGGWLAASIGWLLLGLSQWATLVAGGYTSVDALGEDLAVCVAATALAVVAGFASLIPGGAVVREAVLFELLAPRYGKAPALVSAILSRLVWLVAELIISGILYAVSPRRRTDVPPN